MADDARLWVGFSGGLDSTVLLHALRRLVNSDQLRAVHVNHQLHRESPAWAKHCQQVCAGWGVPLQVAQVVVSDTGGKGLEAAARTARYGAMADVLTDQDWLVTAHHADDQLETLLMRLMRGSGPQGLAGMRVCSTQGRLQIWRPWLEVPREMLEAYAREKKLAWLEDPSNSDLALDRNYLRHTVVPQLRARWPAAVTAAARAARHQESASGLLAALAAVDGDPSADVLPVATLTALPRQRALNLLRTFLQRHGVSPPGEAQLTEGLTQLLGARSDRQPCLAWSDGQLRRYRGQVYLLPPVDLFAPPVASAIVWDGQAPIRLPAPGGRLSLAVSAEGGLDPGRLSNGIEVRFRQGAESIQPAGMSCHRALKKLFQEAGVVPWMRPHVPLLYADDELVAVAHLWTADHCMTRPGTRGIQVQWHPGARFQ